MTARQKS